MIPRLAARLFAFIVDRLARRDRTRHIAQCSAYGGKLAVEPAHDPSRRPSFYEAEAACSGPGWERLRPGAARFEAFVQTARDIELLPCVEPKRTLAP